MKLGGLLGASRSLLSRGFRSQFGRNATRLMAGNLAGQVVTFASVPIVARLFRPEDFGVMAVFSTVVMIYDRVDTLCYERAILLPASDREAAHVAVLAYTVLVGMTAAAVGGVYLLERNGAFLSTKFGILSDVLYFLPVAFFLTGFVKVNRFWLLREKSFSLVAKSRVGEALVGVAVRIGSGALLGSSSLWLVFSMLSSFAASATITSLNKNGKRLMSFVRDAHIVTIRSVGKRYDQFPIYATSNAFVNSFSQQTAILFFSFVFSPAVVGFYGMARNVLKKPIVLLSESVRNAYFQRAASDNAVGILREDIYLKLTGLLAASAIIPFTILFLWGERIFTLLLGSPWREAGSYIECLAPWFFLLFVSSPTNVIYEVVQRQEVRLRLTLLRLAGSVVGLGVGYVIDRKPLTSLTGFVVVNCLVECVSIIVGYRLVRMLNKGRPGHANLLGGGVSQPDQ